MSAPDTTGRSRIPWVILTTIAAPLLLATLVFTAINGSFREDGAFIGVAIVMIVGYCGVGALVASRAPGNPVGWLMVAVGISFLLAAFTDEYSRFAIERGGAPLDVVAYWLSTWWYVVFFVALPLMLLLFPDGRLLSRRWRVVVQAELAAGSVALVLSMFAPGRLDLDVPEPPDNPLGVEALHVLEPLGLAAFMVMLLVAILAVVSLMLRYRRSQGPDRQRLRLFTDVVVLALMLLLAAAASGFTGSQALNDVLFIAFASSIGIGIPAAMAIAILRFRMFDVEVVIRKTVRFVVVAALIAVVLGVVVLVASGPVVGRLVDPSRPATILTFGIAIGLLVRPLWRVSRRIADRVVFGGRSTPYEVLTEFSQRVGESYSTEDVLPRMAAVLGNAVGAVRADIWLGVGTSQRHAAGWPDGEPPTSPGDDTCAISYQGEELGSLSVLMPANDPMNESKERLMADLAAQAGPVIRNVRLVEDLRESRRRIVTAQDERARTLERNIHDGAQQQLVALAVQAKLARGIAEREPVRMTAMLELIQAGANDALENLRDLARGIYPPLLADKGLPVALEAQGRKAAMPVTLHADGVGRYAQEIESAVYFCVLEALTNSAKYAQASQVTITLAEQQRHLTFAVTDDGDGFDASSATYGTGLQGMTDRLEALGGSLAVTSAPGRGTTVQGTAPA
ncbi:MAG: histidine kinase [Actinomycetota bacterium]